ncbi:MAG: ZIP family metal transporter [Thermodesulfobacteriota bacterium]
MIAIPSFLLGTALGISDTAAALMIVFAIMAHKGTAAFALALAMVRSTMTKAQTYVLLGIFVCSTPLGILVGHAALVAKATILSLAAGVFLFMATLHEMKHSPIIIHCCTVRGFGHMLAGLVITAFVRLILGLAHTGHPLCLTPSNGPEKINDNS